jgi:hypothetical protein
MDGWESAVLLIVGIELVVGSVLVWWLARRMMAGRRVENTKPVPPNGQQPNGATLPILVELMKARVTEQADTVTGLDSKMVQVFAAATVLVGLVAAGVRDYASPRSATVLLAIAIGSYAFVALMALIALRVRTVSTFTDPDELWNRYWNSTPFELRFGLAHVLAQAFRDNRRPLREKVIAVQLGMLATAIEAVCIGAALVVKLI